MECLFDIGIKMECFFEIGINLKWNISLIGITNGMFLSKKHWNNKWNVSLTLESQQMECFFDISIC